MASLVDDLLSLSRVEAEERRRPTEKVDLRTLVASVAATLEPLATRSGTELRLVLPEGSVTVPGDSLDRAIEALHRYGELVIARA